MIVIWADTETTGIDPRDSGPFEIAILVYVNGKCAEEHIYNLNPLNDEVLIHEDALKVNGATEEMIRSLAPAHEVVPHIAELFKKYSADGKLIFAGYNCPFDYGHLAELLFREGYNMGDYFSGHFIDVLELSRMAEKEGILEPTKNHKLTTMTKALGIEHDDAHSAMADIKATRKLYEAIYRIYRNRQGDKQ